MNRTSRSSIRPSSIRSIPPPAAPKRAAKPRAKAARGLAKTKPSRRPAAPRPRQGRHGGSDDRVVAELLAQYTPIVRQIACGFQRRLPRNVLRDDLLAAGMSGLWDAIRRHGRERSDGFEWYVRVRVRAQDWLPRRARAAAAEADPASGRMLAPAVVRFDDVSEWEQSRCLSTNESASSEMSLDAKFVRENLTRAVQQLPERERHIVASHYFQGIKFKDLGVELGVSEPRISQLHSRAMQRLKAIISAAA
jgi:RNA polymerase sigma factor for flagellar operon FliA